MRATSIGPTPWRMALVTSSFVTTSRSTLSHPGSQRRHCSPIQRRAAWPLSGSLGNSCWATLANVAPAVSSDELVPGDVGVNHLWPDHPQSKGGHRWSAAGSGYRSQMQQTVGHGAHPFTGRSPAAARAGHVARHWGFQRLARIGILSRALVYLVLSGLIIEMAVRGHPSAQVRTQGAFDELARQPAGPVLLAVLGAGLLAVCRLALRPRRLGSTRRRDPRRDDPSGLGDHRPCVRRSVRRCRSPDRRIAAEGRSAGAPGVYRRHGPPLAGGTRDRGRARSRGGRRRRRPDGVGGPPRRGPHPRSVPDERSRRPSGPSRRESWASAPGGWRSRSSASACSLPASPATRAERSRWTPPCKPSPPIPSVGSCWSSWAWDSWSTAPGRCSKPGSGAPSPTSSPSTTSADVRCAAARASAWSAMRSSTCSSPTERPA